MSIRKSLVWLMLGVAVAAVGVSVVWFFGSGEPDLPVEGVNSADEEERQVGGLTPRVGLFVALG